MLTAVLIAVLVTIAIVIGTSVLLFVKLQRTHWRTLDAMQRWVVSSLSSIETRLRFQSGLDAPGTTDVVVVVTRDRSTLLEPCLRSIHRHEPSAHVIVVDVGSADETVNVLQRLVRERVVSTIISHAPETVPQWQKGYGIHEAWRVASMLHPRSMTVIDDDMVVREPFLAACAAVCEHADIRVVALHRDSTQEKNHPVVKTLDHAGMRIELGATFNGAAFYLPWTTLNAWGPPPFNEGKRESGVEDWYYSRALEHEGKQAAFLHRVDEQVNVTSLRDAVQTVLPQSIIVALCVVLMGCSSAYMGARLSSGGNLQSGNETGPVASSSVHLPLSVGAVFGANLSPKIGLEFAPGLRWSGVTQHVRQTRLVAGQPALLDVSVRQTARVIELPLMLTARKAVSSSLMTMFGIGPNLAFRWTTTTRTEGTATLVEGAGLPTPVLGEFTTDFEDDPILGISAMGSGEYMLSSVLSLRADVRLQHDLTNVRYPSVDLGNTPDYINIIVGAELPPTRLTIGLSLLIRL